MYKLKDVKLKSIRDKKCDFCEELFSKNELFEYEDFYNCKKYQMCKECIDMRNYDRECYYENIV